MFTPWGAPKRTLRLEPGITAVLTPRHGGLLLSRGYAPPRFSPPARHRAVRFGEYYAYEIEHAWAIPMLELPHLWAALGRFCKPDLLPAPERHLREIVSAHHPDYSTPASGAAGNARGHHMTAD